MPKDKTIKCITCEDEFVFEAGEQEYFKSIKKDKFTGKELPDGMPEPKRCPTCRAAKKAIREKYFSKQ